MGAIRTMTRFSGVEPVNAEAFRQAAREGAERAAGEPGTVGYEWYESADGATFVAHERFVDSDAVLAHATNVGDLVGRWIELSSAFEIQIFGSPSDELAAALADMAPQVYPAVTD